MRTSQRWTIMIPGSETVFNGMRHEQPNVIGYRAYMTLDNINNNSFN